jgi:hypothetical protein
MESKMRTTKKILKAYESLISELESNRPTGKWRLQRRLANAVLRLCAVRVMRDDLDIKYGGGLDDSSLTELERRDIKEAIELRRKIYRMMKEIKDSKTLSSWK